MKKKRVRFCLKWFDGSYIELLSIRPYRDGLVMWTPSSKRHIMTIKEVGAISSHITNQETDEHTPLGRLIFENVDIDEELVKLAKLRRLEESEYDQILLYQNREFWDILLNYELDLVTEEREKDILRYIDLSKMFEDIQERMGMIRASEIIPFLTCKASDLLDMKDVEAGFTEHMLAVFEHEGKLYEMDIQYLSNFGSKDHPWADILKPLGIFELLGEIDLGEKFREA